MSEEQKRINEHWSQDSDNYDSIIHDELSSFRLDGWQQKIGQQVNFRKGLRALDCGCGPGFFTIILSKAGYKVTGIDAAEGMLQKARRNVLKYGGGADIIEMDCSKLRFGDGCFDLVLSRNVTHTLIDHVGTYREWQRVLKPGGVLLIFDANWHLAYENEEMLRETLEREKKCIETFGSDFSGNTVFDEQRARAAYENRPRHRLGSLQRPDWDCGILKCLGFEDIYFERDITKELWDDKEKLIYGHTPMFMLRAVKK